MELKVFTNKGVDLKEAKKIYLNLDIEMHYNCPICSKENKFDTRVPFIVNNFNGTYYTHHLYCEHCHEETKEKMYDLISIKDDTIEVEFNKKFKISLYKKVLKKIY